MATASRSSLKLLSIATGLLFTGAIFYKMHYNPRWDWTALGIGQLPQTIVGDFMYETYERGHGAMARESYFAADVIDNAANAWDASDGAPIPHEVHQIVAQGMTVAVIHRIGAARGQPEADAIDVFQIKDGRIVRRDRYSSQFAQ